jgi:hypothetical protein
MFYGNPQSAIPIPKSIRLDAFVKKMILRKFSSFKNILSVKIVSFCVLTKLVNYLNFVPRSMRDATLKNRLNIVLINVVRTKFPCFSRKNSTI